MKYLMLGAITEAPAEPVNCLAPCRRRDPAAGIRGHALGAPVLKRLDERVLHELLGQPDIAQPGGQPGQDPGARLAVGPLQLAGLVHTRKSCSTVRSRLSGRC
jgi:hypothetical protein